MDFTYYKELMASVFRELNRYRISCVLLFAIVLVCVVSAGFYMPRKYVSDVLVYIDVSNIIEPLLRGRAEVSDIDRSEKAMELIYTRSLLERVASDAGLVEEGASTEKVDAAVAGLRRNITVEGESKNYFRIVYSAETPEQSFQTMNALVDVFLNDRATAKREESEGAYSFINRQVGQYRKQLDLAEAKLQAAKAESLNVTEDSVRARIAQLTTQIQNLKITIQETEAKIKATRQLLNQENEYLYRQSKMASLQDRRRALTQELDRLRLSYQDSYPDIVSLKDQIAELDEAIQKLGPTAPLQNVTTTPSTSNNRGPSDQQASEPLFEELRKQLSVAEVDLETQKRRLMSLQNLLVEEKQQAEQVAKNQTNLAELQRDYDVLVEAYEEMLRRQENAKLSMALNVGDGGESYKVVEEPVYPREPVGVTFKHFAVAAPLLALGAPLGLLLGFIMLDPRIRSASHLTQVMPENIEVIGTVPHFSSPSAARSVKREWFILSVFIVLVIAAYAFLTYIGLTDFTWE